MTEIKICGIKDAREITYLNETNVSYAGFVLYPPSKRYIKIEDTGHIFDKLNQNIRKVAVTVSPDLKLIEAVEQAGFDIIQIHGEIDIEILKQCKIPVWLAVNLQKQEEKQSKSQQEKPQQKEISQKEIEQEKAEQKKAEQDAWAEYMKYINCKNVQAVLVDAKDFGSGKTFDWSSYDVTNQNHDATQQYTTTTQQTHNTAQYIKTNYASFRKQLKQTNKKFILAGGLTPDNVKEGIRIFTPDIVDVSSGVEGSNGKDFDKITKFVNQVRGGEQ